MMKSARRQGVNQLRHGGLSLSQYVQWFLVFLLVVILMAQVFVVQMRPDPRAVSQLSGQYQITTRSAGDRGTIYDAAGEPLALSVPTQSLFLDPQVEGWDHSRLEALLPLVGEKERKALTDGELTKRFYWLKRYCDDQEAQQILDAGGKGVFSRLERKRVYPKGSIFSHLLGFTDSDGLGLAGIELKWNNVLYVPERIHVNYRGTSTFLFREDLNERSMEQGLYLTVDSQIQYALERFLGPAAEKNQADWAAAVVLDSATGAVLGMASWPAYDPNDRSTFTDPERLKNNVINRVYEPGSTFKPLVVGLALERGIIKTNSGFRCPAYLKIADKVMRDSHPRDNGTLSVTQILEKSSNVGMAQIGMKMDPYKTYDEMVSLGFARKTGIMLNGEEQGLVNPPDRWLGVSPANVAIGQGFAVTPLQLVVAFNSLINGGKVMRPYIVDHAIDAQGNEVLRQEPQEVNRMFSPQTSRWMRKVLRGVVTNGTAKSANSSMVEIGAKTGTAQVAKGRGYVKGLYHASMIGCWPIEDPKYTMLVVFGNVKGDRYYGGQVAGPVFKEIVEEITRLRGTGE